MKTKIIFKKISMMKSKLGLIAILLLSNILWAYKPNLSEAKNFIKNQKSFFEQNKGQISSKDGQQIKYFLKGNNMTFYLLENGIAYQFTKTEQTPENSFLSPEEIIKSKGKSKDLKTETYRIDMILQGANPKAKVTAEKPETATINYYNKNILNIQRYSQITYHNIYPNIDWVIYVKDNDVEYDFIVKPGGNPNQIQFKNNWAETMDLNKDGSVTMSCRLGKITEKSPVSFQNGKEIPTKMKLKDGILSFNVASYNPEETLRIDPVISWSTYFGGTSDDYGSACVVDSSNNVYLTGYTSSNGLASGGYQNTNNGNTDAFLAKFSSTGALLWATYYGGSNEDKGKSLAIDAAGNVYMAGETYSTTNIASDDAHQTTLGGQNDAFLVKFDSNGNRIWATYYGGDFYDEGYSCAVDNSGNVYLSGYAWSNSGITTSGAHQQNPGGSTDAFLVKFDSNGTRQWGTYYGGELWETGYCTTDQSGNVYLTGFTSSTVNIATASAHQTTLGWGDDAYLVKFDSNGVRQWGTYYGGNDYDWAYFIATDSQGNVYLDGHTGSDSVIATSGAYQETRGGSYDAFLAKFNPSGTRIWGTYYGGSQEERASACTVDAADNVILTGYTYSENNIASTGTFQTTYGGSQDAFVAKFDNNGNRIWGTYLGGSGNDYGAFCTTNSSGDVMIAGATNSGNYPTFGSYYQSFNAGSVDSFLTILDLNGNVLKVNDTKTNSLKIYPNPTSDFINIQNVENTKYTKSEIFSMEGRLVYQTKEIINHQINVSNLPKGSYILRLYNNGAVNQFKFIKK